MDVLSDVLHNVRLSGSFLFFAEYRAPWCVASPPSYTFAPMLVPGARKLVIFHIVIDGACVVHRANEEPVVFEAGDAIMMGQGDPHVLADEPGQVPVSLLDLLPALPWTKAPYLVHGGNGPVTRVLCGFLHCADAQLSPFLASLPPLIRVEGRQGVASSLLPVQRLLVEEARAERPGYSSVLSRLTETFFVEALRQQMARSEEPSYALAALKDPVVGAALQRLHEEPMRGWSVEALAREVAVSRSLLATRFTALVGYPPMQYLTRWRLLMAARRLEQGESIPAVGAAIGYESEAAFSRAFKRHLGLPPATWLGKRSGESPTSSVH